MTLQEIQEFLKESLKAHQPTLKITVDKPTQLEVTGTVPIMQGKQKVDGIYFGSVIPKPKDIRLYFFPMYTHRDKLFDDLSPELRKSLKGKSCFHIKDITPKMQTEIKEMIRKSVVLYQNDGLLVQ